MIDAHRGAFEYDWRARFHLGLTTVGKAMTWGEAKRLTEILAVDPSSHVAAALAGWEFPIQRTDATLRDLYDLQHASKSKKRPKPYPRPWPDKTKRRFGNARMSTAQLREVLDRHRGVEPLKRDRNGRLHDARGRFVAEGASA